MKRLVFLMLLGAALSAQTVINGSRTITGNIRVRYANAGVTGTTLNKLAKLTGAPSTSVITAITDTAGIIGIVVTGAGTTGSADIATWGKASCVFDGATTAGHYVINSTSVGGDCSDGGPTYPTSGQVIGVVITTNGGAGTYTVDMSLGQPQAGGAGGGGATNASQLYDFQVTKTAASVLTINAQCSSGLPCVARFGNTAYRFVASSVFTISAGSGTVYWYVAADGTLTAGHNGLSVISCSGCTALNGVTSFPATAIPLWTWNSTTGVWDASGIDYRGWLSLKNVVAGAGVATSESSGTTTVGVDTAVVGLRVAVPPTSTTTCTSGSWASDVSNFYTCVATNTWRRVAVGTW